MAYANFPTSGMYAVTACMLHLLGHQHTDMELALRIHLPCLISIEDGEYRAGTSLCSPKWMDLALLPLGFHMVEETLPADEVPQRLQTLPTAAIELPVFHGKRHWVVYAGIENRRYHFLNMRINGSPEPEDLWLTPGQLRKGLSEQAIIRYLVPCPPQQVNMVPHLIESLKTLVSYHQALHALWQEHMVRSRAKVVRSTILRPLLSYMTPVSILTGDTGLYHALNRLRGCLLPMFYGRILIIHLDYHVPFYHVSLMLHAFREHILDTLYELGVDEDTMDWLYEYPAQQ